MGSIGIGRSIVDLHVYTPNLLDAEASYQCSKDFAISIPFGEHGMGLLLALVGLGSRVIMIFGVTYTGTTAPCGAIPRCLMVS
jgi:hypothetical protein